MNNQARRDEPGLSSIAVGNNLMKKILLIGLAIFIVVSVAMAGVITRDGERVTPLGEGTVILDAGTFEAFPLPQYAAKHLADDYKSYLVEVEAD